MDAVGWIFSNTLAPEKRKSTCFVPCVRHGLYGRMHVDFRGDGDASKLVAAKLSGVNAAGVNLGCQSRDWFEKHGLSERLAEKLAPFFGKRGECAVKALASAGPVKLNAGEARDLLSAYLRGVGDECVSFFDGSEYPDWRTLPECVRTALLSLVGACGFGVFDRHVQLKEAIKESRFLDAEEVLRKGHTVWGGDWPLRAREGALLGLAAR